MNKLLHTLLLCTATLGVFSASAAQPTPGEILARPAVTSKEVKRQLLNSLRDAGYLTPDESDAAAVRHGATPASAVTKGEAKRHLLNSLRDEGLLTPSDTEEAASRNVDADDALRLDTAAKAEFSLAPQLLTKGAVKRHFLENLRNDGFLTKAEIDAAALRHADPEDDLLIETRVPTSTVSATR